MVKGRRKIKPRGWVAIIFVGLALVALVVNLTPSTPRVESFQLLEKGLEWAEFKAKVPSADGDSIIRVLRADPAYFDLSLHMASEAMGEKSARSVKEWAREGGLVAAINAAMYQKNGYASVSLMKKRGHINNPRLSRDRSLLLFDPVDPVNTPVRMVDLEDGGSEDSLTKYWSAVQSIRMLSPEGLPTWKKGDEGWPASLVGMDGQGRILFIHTKSSYPMYELVRMLTELPLDLKRLQYGEGGSEAQLYVESGELRSLYAPGGVSWDVPNVLGLKRRVTR